MTDKSKDQPLVDPAIPPVRQPERAAVREDPAQAKVYPQDPSTVADGAQQAPEGRYHGYTPQQIKRMEDSRATKEEMGQPSEQAVEQVAKDAAELANEREPKASRLAQEREAQRVAAEEAAKRTPPRGR